MDAATRDVCIMIGAFAAVVAIVTNFIGLIANIIKLYEFGLPWMTKLHEEFVADMATDWPLGPAASFFLPKKS